MSTELIINASLPETRIALVENGEIQEILLERASDKGIVGNIYKGRVTRVLPGMQAAFVDIGLDKAAFLYVDDIYVHQDVFEDEEGPSDVEPTEERSARGSQSVSPRGGGATGGSSGGLIGFSSAATGQSSGGGATSEESDSPEHWAAAEDELHLKESAPEGTTGSQSSQETESRASHDSDVNEESDLAEDLAGDDDLDEESEDERPVEMSEDPKDLPEGVVAEESGRESGAEQSGESESALSVYRRKAAELLAQRGGRATKSAKPNQDKEKAEAQTESDVEGDSRAAGGSDPGARDPRRKKKVSKKGSKFKRRPGASEAASAGAVHSETKIEDGIVSDAASSPEERTASKHQLERSDERSDHLSHSLESVGRAMDEGDLESDRTTLDQGNVQPESNRKPLFKAIASRGEPAESGRPAEVAAAPGAVPERRIKTATKADFRAPRGKDHRVRPKMTTRMTRAQVNIQDLLQEGQEVLVQVAKDPIATKGARLTCHISLPGRHLVCMPTIDHVGVSRRIDRDDERRRLRDFVDRNRPRNLGFIVRTASGKQSDRRLKQDIEYLSRLWSEIKERAATVSAPALVYEDLNPVLRAIRDWVTEDLDKILVDSRYHFGEIQKFVSYFMPSLRSRVELYHGDIPIFDAYNISTEVSRALERKVWLKSGGYLVIDQAEALVAIDVNTGRFVGKKNLEDTILKTNLEAVQEVAYQLRLRNCGGIIIIDLIDMEKEESKNRVYRALEEALKKDRARPSILKISEIGLIEMTRKRTRDTMVRALCEPCSHCEGKGYIKGRQTVAFEVLREIEREGIERDIGKILVQAHPEVIDILAINCRETIEQLEKRYRKHIYLQAILDFHPEQFEVTGDKKRVKLLEDVQSQRERERQRLIESHAHLPETVDAAAVGDSEDDFEEDEAEVSGSESATGEVQGEFNRSPRESSGRMEGGSRHEGGRRGRHGRRDRGRDRDRGGDRSQPRPSGPIPTIRPLAQPLQPAQPRDSGSEPGNYLELGQEGRGNSVSLAGHLGLSLDEGSGEIGNSWGGGPQSSTSGVELGSDQQISTFVASPGNSIQPTSTEPYSEGDDSQLAVGLGAKAASGWTQGNLPQRPLFNKNQGHGRQVFSGAERGRETVVDEDAVGNRVLPAPRVHGEFEDEEDRLAYLRAQAAQDAAIARLGGASANSPSGNIGRGGPSGPRFPGGGGGGADRGGKGRRGRRGGRNRRGPGGGGGGMGGGAGRGHHGGGGHGSGGGPRGGNRSFNGGMGDGGLR